MTNEIQEDTHKNLIRKIMQGTNGTKEDCCEFKASLDYRLRSFLKSKKLQLQVSKPDSLKQIY